MKEVFSEGQIAGVKLKNKIIRSATHEALADDLGNPTETLITKYEALAKGEVGAIITGYAAIMQNGKSPLANMLMIDNDEKIPHYKKLVDRVIISIILLYFYRSPIVVDRRSQEQQVYLPLLRLLLKTNYTMKTFHMN